MWHISTPWDQTVGIWSPTVLDFKASPCTNNWSIDFNDFHYTNAMPLLNSSSKALTAHCTTNTETLVWCIRLDHSKHAPYIKGTQIHPLKPRPIVNDYISLYFIFLKALMRFKWMIILNDYTTCWTYLTNQSIIL